jgi:hypothetical protein
MSKIIDPWETANYNQEYSQNAKFKNVLPRPFDDLPVLN